MPCLTILTFAFFLVVPSLATAQICARHGSKVASSGEADAHDSASLFQQQLSEIRLRAVTAEGEVEGDSDKAVGESPSQVVVANHQNKPLPDMVAPDELLLSTPSLLAKAGEEVVSAPAPVPQQSPPLARLSKLLQEAPAMTTAEASAIASAAASALVIRASGNWVTAALLVGFLLLFIMGMAIAGFMLFVDHHPPVKTRSAATACRASGAVPLVEDWSPPPITGNPNTTSWTGSERTGGGWATLWTGTARPWQGAGSPPPQAASSDRWGFVFSSDAESSPPSDASGSHKTPSEPPTTPSPPPPPHYLASAVKPPSQLSLRTVVPMPMRQLEQFAQTHFYQRATSPPSRGQQHRSAALRRATTAQLSQSMIGFEDLTVPDGMEILLAVPSLVPTREKIGAPGAALDYHITDDGGRRLLGVTVDRMPESSGASGNLVMERISLVDFETRQPHGHCELCLPSGGMDVELQASILSANGSQQVLVLEVSNLQGQRAALVGSSDGSSTQLIVQTHNHATRGATISSQDRFFAAGAEPGHGSQPGGGAEFYWLRVAPGTNTGLVILALLAMDRLPPSIGGDPRMQHNAPPGVKFR